MVASEVRPRENSVTTGSQVGVPQAARSTVFWTNPSVLALAQESDPVEVITERARSLVFKAMEQGWKGPPFDPFQLADLLKIPVVPREDLHDARIVPTGGGRVQIEFNPSRPRARVRYNLAHELAHALFSDCGTTVRHRGRADERPDAWQIELLCNIAAAELLMPIGTFEQLRDEPLSIEHLMELRSRFEVSAEAILLRAVRLTAKPASAFAAAHVDLNKGDSSFRIDYAVGSRQWPARVPRGYRVPSGSVLGECSAVGYTAKGRESWPSVGPVRIECVGIPPFPGHRFPRVVGIMLASHSHELLDRGITYLYGDATKPRGTGARLVAHLVNDKTPNWHGPFATAIRSRWPFAQEEFRSWAHEHAHLKLGEVLVAEVEPGISVATMVAQHGYGPSPKPRLRYEALRACLAKVAEAAVLRGATVHTARIGTGEAGGSWSIVKELIDEALVRRGVPVTVYTLPPKADTAVGRTTVAASAG